MARGLFEALILALLCGTFVRTFLLQASMIPSPSMEQTLLVGDHILVNRFIYAHLRAGEPAPAFLPMRDVERGDVVVFESPRRPGHDLVKRCLGRPGETLEIAGHTLRVDGRDVPESYRGDDPRQDDTYGPSKVPPGHYFLLGDRRDASSDSRSWGALPAERVRGRAWLVYWSFDPAPDEAEWSMIRKISRSRWDRCFSRIHTDDPGSERNEP